MANAQASRREALRAQQLAAARAARTRKMVGIGAAVAALILVVVFAVVAVNTLGKGGGSVVPPNAVLNAYGVSTGTNPDSKQDGIGVYTDKAKAGVPVVQLYADYQCPGCKQFDDAFGPALEKLAQDGDIKLSVQIETFLDRLGPGKSTNPAIAAACSDVVGAFPAYHLAIFKGQPEKEGVGYTTQQLRVDFPAAAGITGEKLTQFQQCYDAKSTGAFVEQQNKFNTAYTSAMYEKNGGQGSPEGQAWGSTPLITVNGKRLDHGKLVVTDPNSLSNAIKALATA